MSNNGEQFNKGMWGWIDSGLPDYEDVTKNRIRELFRQVSENIRSGKWYSSQNKTLLRSILAEVDRLPCDSESASNPASDMFDRPDLLKRWVEKNLENLEDLNEYLP